MLINLIVVKERMIILQKNSETKPCYEKQSCIKEVVKNQKKGTIAIPKVFKQFHRTLAIAKIERIDVHSGSLSINKDIIS